MRKREMRAGWILGTMLLLALPAWAGDPASARPCRDDMERLCADVEGGAFTLMRCLSDHRDELSDACRNSLTSERQQSGKRFVKLSEACQSDLERFCPATRGPLHVVHCLHKHEADLSEGCRSALPPKPAGASSKTAPPKSGSGPAESAPESDAEPAAGF